MGALDRRRNLIHSRAETFPFPTAYPMWFVLRIMINRKPIIRCDRCRAEGVAGAGQFAGLGALLDFTPVPRKYRHDGWTPERQVAFIEALASTGSVSLAAKAVNMSAEGAYYLRRQKGAEEFARAWALALDYGGDRIEDAALDRAIHGVAVPLYHKGEQVGERRVHNERLTMWMLQHRKPGKYGHARSSQIEADDLEKADSIRERDMNACAAQLEKLSQIYGNRIRQERRERLAGNVVAADFYLRQLTHMEVLIELGGGGKYLLWWANGGNGSGDDPHNMGVEIASTDITAMLDEHRRKNWALAGEPDRPKHFGNRAMIGQGIMGGPDRKQREELMRDARARAAAAQLMWEEAVRDQIRLTEPMAADARSTESKTNGT